MLYKNYYYIKIKEITKIYKLKAPSSFMKLADHFQAINLGLMDNLIMFIALIIGIFQASGNIKLVLLAGLIAGIANSFSNCIAYYTSEEAERGQQIQFYKNKKTTGAKYIHTKEEIITGSMLNFFASFAALLIPLIPIILIPDVFIAMIVSVALATIILAFMGYEIAILNETDRARSIAKYIMLAILGALIGFVFGELLKFLLIGI